MLTTGALFASETLEYSIFASPAQHPAAPSFPKDCSLELEKRHQLPSCQWESPGMSQVSPLFRWGIETQVRF